MWKLGKIGFLSTFTRSLYWLQGPGYTAGFFRSKTALYSVPMCLLLHTELWPDICWWHKMWHFCNSICNCNFPEICLIWCFFLWWVINFVRITALTSRLCSISSASVCQSPWRKIPDLFFTILCCKMNQKSYRLESQILSLACVVWNSKACLIPNLSEWNWVLFHKTGYQYIRFTGSYSDKALGLTKNMSSSKGWSEADPKQGMKFHPQDQMRREKLFVGSPAYYWGSYVQFSSWLLIPSPSLAKTGAYLRNP